MKRKLLVVYYIDGKGLYQLQRKVFVVHKHSAWSPGEEHIAVVENKIKRACLI